MPEITVFLLSKSPGTPQLSAYQETTTNLAQQHPFPFRDHIMTAYKLIPKKYQSTRIKIFWMTFRDIRVKISNLDKRKAFSELWSGA